jgi:flagellin
MAMVINTNIASLTAQRNLSSSQSALQTSLQRLSSGLRINSAKDDAAGLAISERFSTQIRGMNVAMRNANDGISLAQSAEGAMTEIGNNLQRIRELAVQSRNATNSDSDRAALNAEATQLKAEIQRVAEQTSFNGTKLLDGSFTAQAFQVGANQGQTIEIDKIVNAKSDALGSWTAVAEATTSVASGAFTDTGAAVAAGENFKLTLDGVAAVDITSTAAGETVTAADIDAQLTANKDTLAAAGYTFTGTAAAGDLKFSKADGSDMTIDVTHNFAGGTGGTFADPAFEGAQTGGIEAGEAMTGFASVNISTAAGADNAMLAMDAALKSLNSARADMGAVQNRFTSVVASLQTTSENLSASRSRILDADFASETANLTRGQILQQAGTAMLAQANSLPNGVLALLRG